MTTEELQALLLGHGVACDVRKDEVAVHTCLFCGNTRRNLELNPAVGVYHCWACRSGGRLDRLLASITGEAVRLPVRYRTREATERQDAADIVTTAVSASPVASKFLERRSISPAVTRRYDLAVCAEPNNLLHGRLVVPALDYWDGHQVGWWGRSYTGGFPKYVTTFRNVVVGWRTSPSAPCVVVEGPFDGIAAGEAGMSAAVLTGTSNVGWRDFVARRPTTGTLVVMLDADALDMARILYWQARELTDDVVLAELPPGTDPASLGPAGVREVVLRAVRPLVRT